MRSALQDPETGAGTAIRIGTAWSLVGITSWADAAAAAAFIYTVLLMGEWMWKKIIRPICERRGWVKRRSFSRRSTDQE